MKNNRPIAFFDSGVGGLTVYTKLKSLLPNESYIYFGDTLNMPYGEKNKEQLLAYADKIIGFFVEKNAKAVVMACNTTSSVIYEDIKDKYGIKIYPVVQSVAGILATMPIKKLGVFATNATVKANAYKKEIQLLNPNLEVIQIACPKWVNIVENNEVNSPQSVSEIQDKINEMMGFKPDKIVLGCTHYPFLKDVLSEFAPPEIFIDPSEYFVQFIQQDLKSSCNIDIDGGTEEFYVSSNPKKFKESAKLFYNLPEVPKLKFNIE